MEEFKMADKKVPYLDHYTHSVALLDSYQEVTSQSADFEKVKEIYENFLSRYPFNHKYWNKYAQMFAEGEQSDLCLTIYARAVELNPRSYDLWNCFCSWLSHVHGATNPKLVVQWYEAAISKVGFDENTINFVERYVHFTKPPDIVQAEQIYWKPELCPVSNIASFVNSYTNFLKHVTPKEIPLIAKNHGIEAPEQDVIKLLITKLELTYKDRCERHSDILANSIESITGSTEYNGVPVEKEALQKVLNLLKATRLVGTRSISEYIHEKTIAILTECEAVWMSYLYDLENHATRNVLHEFYNKYCKLIELIFNLTNVSCTEPLTFFAELFETEGKLPFARSIYKQMLGKSDSLSAYLKQIAFEKRCKNFDAATETYLGLIAHYFGKDTKLFSQTFNEFFNFCLENELVQEGYKAFWSYFDRLEPGNYFISCYLLFLSNSHQPWEKFHELFTAIVKKINEKKITPPSSALKIFLNLALKRCPEIKKIREYQRRIILEEYDLTVSGDKEKKKFEQAFPGANMQSQLLDHTNKLVKKA